MEEAEKMIREFIEEYNVISDIIVSLGVHMILAVFIVTGFAVTGLHAFLLLKDRENLLHREAFNIALGFGPVVVLLQPLSGDRIAKIVADLQPEKVVAMEEFYETQRRGLLTK